MLNGIGGHSIEEAKESLTYEEVQTWMSFRKMRGSIFFGNRIESGTGLLAYMVNRAAGGKAELIDFLPHAERPEMSIKEFFKAIGG